MKAIWKDTVIAESDDTVVVDGNHYFPESALRSELVEPSEHTTVCPWKGTASYLSIRVDGATNSDAIWIYRDPKPEAQMLADRVAFWKGVEVVE